MPVQLPHELHGAGLSLRAIAGQLNGEEVPTARGGAWHPQSRLVARCLAALPFPLAGVSGFGSAEHAAQEGATRVL
jgi:hypothetical protein